MSLACPTSSDVLTYAQRSEELLLSCPLLSEGNRCCILCIPPKIHNRSLRGNIIQLRLRETVSVSVYVSISVSVSVSMSGCECACEWACGCERKRGYVCVCACVYVCVCARACEI